MALQTGKTNRTALGRLTARFVRDESGSAAIEYGLIAAIITVALIGSLLTLQQSVSDALYNPQVANALVQSSTD